jgi:hypothetical protein
MFEVRLSEMHHLYNPSENEILMIRALNHINNVKKHQNATLIALIKSTMGLHLYIFQPY